MKKINFIEQFFLASARLLHFCENVFLSCCSASSIAVVDVAAASADAAAAAASACDSAGTDDNDNFGNGCDRSDDRWRTLWEHGRMDTGPIRWRKVPTSTQHTLSLSHSGCQSSLSPKIKSPAKGGYLPLSLSLSRRESECVKASRKTG